VCCNVLPCVCASRGQSYSRSFCRSKEPNVLQGVAACCSVLQCGAVCCSVLQCPTHFTMKRALNKHTQAVPTLKKAQHSLPLSLSLALFLSLYLCVSRAFSPPHSLSLSLSLSLFLSLYLFVSRALSPPLSLCRARSLSLPFSPSLLTHNHTHMHTIC